MVTGAAALLAAWLLLLIGGQVLVAVTGIMGLLIFVGRRRRALAVRDAGLRARADYEHRLTIAGDPRGVYGRYPPVQPGWFRRSAEWLAATLFRRRRLDAVRLTA